MSWLSDIIKTEVNKTLQEDVQTQNAVDKEELKNVIRELLTAESTPQSLVTAEDMKAEITAQVQEAVKEVLAETKASADDKTITDTITAKVDAALADRLNSTPASPQKSLDESWENLLYAET